MDEQKITFQVAADVPLPLRVTVGAPKEGVPANRVFETRGPHECTPAEWKRLERRTVGLAKTEEREDGEKVIVGRNTIRAFELVPAAESKVRPFSRKKNEADEESEQ